MLYQMHIGHLCNNNKNMKNEKKALKIELRILSVSEREREGDNMML